MRTNSILIVDDDEKLCALLRSYFEQERFMVYVAHDGMTALHTLRTQKPQIMLLDLMMPGMDGFEVCRRIRQFSDIPIIFLSAKDDETDRLVGLNMGGDDYVTKPFNPVELLARVRALLRRTQEETPSAVMTLGDVTLDRESHRVTAGGQEIALTHMEFELLAFLMAHAGKAVTREVLLDDVWGIAYSGDTRTIDVHVRTLRQKLGDSGRLIATIRNVGYRMDEHPEAGES